jgi:predicted dehydrogenase
VTDVGALLDLGVHDVDLVRFLTGHEYVAATVTVTARLSDRRESAASIEAVLDDGTPVRHEIAWTTTGMGRSVTILPTADSVDSIDLGVANGSASLRAQAAAFVATCAGDRDPRLASAVDGLRAVEVVTGSLPELSSLRASNYA